MEQIEYTVTIDERVITYQVTIVEEGQGSEDMEFTTDLTAIYQTAKL